MFRRTRPRARPLAILFVAASLCLLGGLAAAALVGLGVLPRAPLMMAAIVLGVGLVALFTVLFALELLARSREDNLLQGSEDLSTLTFPAAPRVHRPILHRVK